MSDADDLGSYIAPATANTMIMNAAPHKSPAPATRKGLRTASISTTPSKPIAILTSRNYRRKAETTVFAQPVRGALSNTLTSHESNLFPQIGEKR